MREWENSPTHATCILFFLLHINKLILYQTCLLFVSNPPIHSSCIQISEKRTSRNERKRRRDRTEGEKGKRRGRREKERENGHREV